MSHTLLRACAKVFCCMVVWVGLMIGLKGLGGEASSSRRHGQGTTNFAGLGSVVGAVVDMLKEGGLVNNNGF